MGAWLVAMLVQVEEALPDDAAGLLDALPALTLLGFAALCVRVAIQAERRAALAYKEHAEVYREREETCTDTLTTTIGTIGALTEEVRTNGHGYQDLARGMDELLEHARRTR